MAFGPIVKKLSRIQSTSQNPKICARIPESKTLPRTMCFWILGSVLDSGKCFGFWKVILISGNFLDYGKALSLRANNNNNSSGCIVSKKR